MHKHEPDDLPDMPHDPLDYEDFDPAVLPTDFFYDPDRPLDTCEFFQLLTR